MDTSMVMDPVVIQIALNEIGPGRLLFGTDFPVAAMRGRRVRIMDHWVDVVLPDCPTSAYRVAGEGYPAGFMAWEIALAIRWAAELAGISAAERDAIFHGNGMRLLAREA
jgi:predicted TIM-barrel fold metal-dependent hydrolase